MRSESHLLRRATKSLLSKVVTACAKFGEHERECEHCVHCKRLGCKKRKDNNYYTVTLASAINILNESRHGGNLRIFNMAKIR